MLYHRNHGHISHTSPVLFTALTWLFLDSTRTYLPTETIAKLSILYIYHPPINVNPPGHLEPGRNKEFLTRVSVIHCYHTDRGAVLHAMTHQHLCLLVFYDVTCSFSLSSLSVLIFHPDT